MTPQVAKPSEMTSGVYSGDVNLFSGDYNSSIKLGSVATPSGLSYELSLNYSSSFSIGNTMPISTGIPYGEGWNLNIPTISIEAEVFNNFTEAQYCTESGTSTTKLDFNSLGSNALKEGDLYWFSPYINIPGVASGRAIFKYIDVNDNKTAVFELNAFENHVEIRYSGDSWTVIASDGTRYIFRTAIQSYNAPANKRVLYYDQSAVTTGTNHAKAVQNTGAYENPGQAAMVENSILPKQRYNLWYCDVIMHRNQPFQGINFTYKGFGKFNYFKEFRQEAYQYAAAANFSSSTFVKEHDFSCYTDLLLLKIEAISIDGLVDRLELNYATDKNLIQNNYNELIDYQATGNGRLDSLYSYQTVYEAGKPETTFESGWKRYEHTKANATTNSDAVSAVDPYLTANGYVRTDAVVSGEIPFSHSFIESPRLMQNKLYPGEIYEIRSRIKRSNPNTSLGNAGTIDMRIVTGDLENPRGLETNEYISYNANTGAYFSEANYHSSRSKVLYSTFNMALKWTLGYGDGDKTISNLFVMPNIPSKYQGFNFQIGPGNSDINYAVSPVDIWNSPTNQLFTENAYLFKYGNPLSYNLKSAADIPGNFGIGLPWNLVSPVYEYMVTHQNTFNYSSANAKDAYRFWWNFNSVALQNGVTTPNNPTKLDNTVCLDEFELIRYSKNPYMLVSVNYYKVNGDVGGLTETGLKLVARKKLEYTSTKCNMLQNYAYQAGDSLQYRPDVYQVFILLKAVREVPLGWEGDTTQLLTTFLTYSKFNNNAVFYQPNQPMNGHFGMVLTQVVDYLGGITKIEYYPVNDARTRYSGSFLLNRSAFCGVVANPGYGTEQASTVHPIVKYVLKNDEDDLVKNNAASGNTGHKRWRYDFDASTKTAKMTQIQIADTRFYNGRRFNYDTGFKKVSVYGPSLMDGSAEYVNRTDYEHYGADFDYAVSFPDTVDYLFHGKLKSVKEYDMSGKLFTEKRINYAYTLAYKNGYTRPNPYREDLVWDQEYDNPGGQYEYRDYYLNLPLAVNGGTGIGIVTGTAAYPYLDIPVFNGSGSDFEQPKFLEFDFYSTLEATNPPYMFHSYFIKKTQEIDRKYDDYLYKLPVGSGTPAPGPFNPAPNPFGSGFTNPVIYSNTLLSAQRILINNQHIDSLLFSSPLMDSTLYYVIGSTSLRDEDILRILLAQGNLSNLVLNRFVTKFGPLSMSANGFSAISVIQQQSYLSDEVLVATLPQVTNRWSLDFLEALFLRNDYLSDPVLQSFTNSSTRRYFNQALFTKILSKQPQFSETVLDNILRSSLLIPADLSSILKNQVITDTEFSTIIGNTLILNNTIVEIIETGMKYPSVDIFGKLMARSPAFSEAEMERIIEAADRDIESSVLRDLIAIYGSRPFLTGFVFRGNPLDTYCNNATLSSWNYIESKTTYEYYEADYKGTSIGKAYKVLMALEDIPGRTVSATDVFGSGGSKTINTLRLKHEPSWQVFSVTKSSDYLPTAKDEKQFFYLYDLKNRYDRYWYNYDLKTVNGETTPFDYVVLNNNQDTLMYTMRWDFGYVETYLEEAPFLPKYDGMAKSRQYGMRTTPFQQMHITKNQRDAKELRKSEYYFYDSRWVVDPYSTQQTVSYNGPSCPGTGTPPVNPAGCSSCMYWKYGTEADFLWQLPFNYCLWKDPVIGYYACPSSVNYAACNTGVELVACNPSIPEVEEEGGPAEMIILTDALKKTLQLRSTVVQVDTVQNRDFSNYRFDRSNTQIADFYIDYSGTDDQNFIRPFRMVYPFDTLATTRVHKRNQHMQPELISNSVGLQTKFYYRKTINKWNINESCTNPNYSFLYNYSSAEMKYIGLPVRVTVGYGRPDSLFTTFEFTNDGQVKKMTTASGHTMEYTFDGFNRLKSVTENGDRLISRNNYQLWKHDFSKTFDQRAAENYVYTVLYQNNTDTTDSREFQKAFLDPLGRTTGLVRAYRGEGNVQVSSGSVRYDNWGRVKVQRKPTQYIDNNPITSLNPIQYNYNNSSSLYHETRYDPDPASLDVRVADPGVAISNPADHVIRKQTWITNNVYMSCELGLSGAELKLILNSGSTNAFRFLRTSVKDQDNKETITYINAFGQTVATLSWSSVLEKVVTLYVYDSYGNLSRTINARRQNTDYQYNILGQLIRETNTDGGEKRYIYNRHGKISGVQDALDRAHVNGSNIPAPRFRKFTYDAYGNLTAQILVTSSYHMDPFCFQHKTLGTEDTYYYDAQGLPHYFEYVFTNRMTQDWLNTYKTIDPVNGGPTPSSGLPSVAPEATSVYEKSMVYGTQQSAPSTLGKLVESYSYNGSGVAVQQISYTYNSEELLASQVILQHPTNVTVNDQFRVKATITYARYNFRGSLLEEKLDLGSDGSVDMKYFYVYDALNRLEEVYAVQADAALTNSTRMVSYKYDDARGVVLSKRYYTDDFSDNQFLNQTVSYAYDARDRLTQIGSTLFNEWLYYDNTLVPNYNNQATVSQADAFNGNIKGTKVRYNFSGAGNAVPLFDKESIYAYRYDGLNRLVSADALVGDFIDAQFANTSNPTPGDAYRIGDESYSYDKIGNLVTLLRHKPGTYTNAGLTVEDFIYTYANGNNRLVKVSDQSTSTDRNYGYDLNGNLLTDSYRTINATTYGRASYAFALTKGTNQVSYLYDGGDQRFFKKVVSSAQTTQEMYVKDALGRDLAIVKFTTVGGVTDQQKEFYVYGKERVAMIVPNTLGNTPSRIQHNEATYFLTDHLGNTRVSYLAAPTAGPYIINAVDYYPYGKILRQYDNGEGDRYLTTQHERDQETGLDYRGARYYDSDVARFLSTDPWANKYPAWSTYNYVMGNPVMLIDPTGKGAEYKKEVAEAMAARARKEENGSYTAEVVENPDQPGDYGVNYSKTVNGKKYEGVQYEGTFKGIIGGGLQKFNGNSKNASHFVGYFFEYSQSSLISGSSGIGRVYTQYHGNHTYTADGTWNSGLQIKTELFSLGGSHGVILSTGPAKDVPLSAIEGLSRSFELNASAILVDLGNKLSWSSEPYNDNGDILIMSASQISVGVGTPFISGGYTTSNTQIQN